MADDGLRTPRLTLRRAKDADIATIHGLVSDFAMVRMLGNWPWPADLAATRLRCFSDDPSHADIAVIEYQGRVVGLISIVRLRLGYFLSDDVAGQGLATEAARAMINAAFQRDDVQYLVSGAWHDNPGSLRVQKKCGFEVIGQHEEPCAARGETVLHIDTRLMRADWARQDWANG